MAYLNPNPYPAQQPPFPLVDAPVLTKTTAVISPKYCAPCLLDLAIVRKVMTITDGFEVIDINGNIVFKVKGYFMTLRDRRVMRDAAGNPIVTLRRKIMTRHDRWQAFRGESIDDKDLIFSLKKQSSGLIQFRTKLNVYLANNTKEDVCDFKVKGSWFQRSCVVYVGESNHIVAQMHKMLTVQSILIGKEHFNVTVYPSSDYAFIVALIVILDEINDDERNRRIIKYFFV